MIVRVVPSMAATQVAAHTNPLPQRYLLRGLHVLNHTQSIAKLWTNSSCSQPWVLRKGRQNILGNHAMTVTYPGDLHNIRLALLQGLSGGCAKSTASKPNVFPHANNLSQRLICEGPAQLFMVVGWGRAGWG